MKKVLNFSVLAIFIALCVGFVSCGNDEDEPESNGGSSNYGTLNINGVDREMDEIWADDGHLVKGRFWFTVGYENDWDFEGQFENWKWENIYVGLDILTLPNKMSGYDVPPLYFIETGLGGEVSGYDNGGYWTLKGGEVIVKSFDLSRKQIKLQFKNISFAYEDIVINGEVLFTFDEGEF